MRKFFAATVALWICSSSAAFADPLTAHDKAYIVAEIATLKTLSACPEFERVPGASITYGDFLGVDRDALDHAVQNAIFLNAGMNYDHSKLIPEVTRLVNSSADDLNEEVSQEKPAFCKKWGAFLSEKGLIRKK
jgi:hypothetical protein